jgi:UDP-2-acetamido-2-deoxy-ribo-hexuluronate aminotransferase
MAIQFIDLKAQYGLLRENINARIQRVLDHGQYIMGPEVAELEGRLAAFTGAGHCISVASGTEALLISLMALGIKPGDEVITTPFTFVATAEVIALTGATPVFVDVEADTCNMDASLIEGAITSRTRAIMPVSLYGQAADMDEINAIAASHGLTVIEDAAQSFGAEYKGRKSCNLSAIGCTSFFPSKPLGCYGDGGAIFTSDERLAQAMREIRGAWPVETLCTFPRRCRRPHGHAAVCGRAGQTRRLRGRGSQRDRPSGGATTSCSTASSYRCAGAPIAPVSTPNTRYSWTGAMPCSSN